MSNGPFYDIGLHVGQVTSQALTKASTGTPQFVLRVKVMGFPDGEVSYAPHKQQYERSIYMAITEGTAGFVIDTLECMGYNEGTFGPLDPASSAHHSFVGQQINLWCKHEQNQKGQWQEKWSVSRPRPQQEFTPIDKKDIRQLDSLFGKALKQRGPSSKPPMGAGKKLDDGTFITDADIPNMDADDDPFA